MAGIAFEPTAFQSTAFQEGWRALVAIASTQSGISRRARSYPGDYGWSSPADGPYPNFSRETKPWSLERVSTMLGLMQRLRGELESPPPISKIAPAPDLALKAEAVAAQAELATEAADLAAARAARDAKIEKIKTLEAKLERMAEEARQRETEREAEEETIILMMVA